MSCEEACEYLLGMYNYMVSVKPEFEVNYETKENSYETCKPYLKVLLKYHPDRRLGWDDSLKMRGIPSDKLSEKVRIDAGRVIDYVKYVKEHECFSAFIKTFERLKEPDVQEHALKSMRSRTPYTQAPASTAEWVHEENREQTPAATRAPERRRPPYNHASSSAHVALLSNYGIPPHKAFTHENANMGIMITDLDDIKARYRKLETEWKIFEEMREQNTMQAMVAAMPPKKTGQELPNDVADNAAHQAMIKERDDIINKTKWYLLPKKSGSKTRKTRKPNKKSKNKSKTKRKQSSRVKSKRR